MIYILFSFFSLHSIFYFKTLSISMDVLVVDFSNCYIVSLWTHYTVLFYSTRGAKCIASNSQKQ